MPYTKLDAGLIHSTVWREPHTTRIVWITLLAMADRHGEVMASVPGLADAARVTQEECRAALDAFLAPDPDSRTPDFEGRRIEKIDGGWFLLNYPEHRKRGDAEDRKRKAAERAARYRARHKAAPDRHVLRDDSVTGRDASRTVTGSHDKQLSISISSKQIDTKENSLTTLGASPLVADFPTAWNLYPKRTGGNSKADALKCWNARIKQGVRPADLLAGVQRYRVFCDATNRTGTEFVKQARTFFGPAEHWTESWEIPPSNGKGKLDWDAAIRDAEKPDV